MDGIAGTGIAAARSRQRRFRADLMPEHGWHIVKVASRTVPGESPLCGTDRECLERP
jgi:hypothetical protein